MDYWLDVKTSDAKELNDAVKTDADAAGAMDAPVSDDGIGLRSEESDKPRGEGLQLLSLLLTIPVGVAIDVAADWIKKYFDRKRDEGHRIRAVTIRYTEESVDADGNVQTAPREYRIEFGES